MSVFAEKRNGVVTGRWIGETQVKKQSFKRPFATHTEAAGYVAYVKATGEEPPNAAKLDAGMTFKQACAEAKNAGGKGGKWLAERDHSLMQRLEHVCALIGDIPVASVGTRDLRRIVDDLRKRPGNRGEVLRTSTINRYLACASAVLSFAKAEGHRAALPEIPMQTEPPGRIETLTEAQERAVCAWLQDKGWDVCAFLVRVLCATGMRSGELYKLAPAQITNDCVELLGAQTKNNQPRSVFIEPSMARELRALVAAKGLPDTLKLWRNFKSACKACEYSEELTLHSLRHTHATRLLDAGWKNIAIRDRMGWKSISMLDRYGHSTREEQRQLVEKMSSQREDFGQNSSVIAFPSEKKA